MSALLRNRSEIEGGAVARYCEGSHQHYGRSPGNDRRKHRTHDPVDAPVFANCKCGDLRAFGEVCRKFVIRFERTVNW